VKRDPLVQVNPEQLKKVASDDSGTARVEYWNRNIPWTFKDEAVDYEEKRRLRYSLQNYMHDVIGFESCKSKLVLELGSGGGIDSAEFARNGAEVVSVDFTETGTRTTLELLKSAGFEYRVVKASVPCLPFRAENFDCVYSFGVLHHIPEIEQALHEISRVLKPGGEIICMLYNRDSLLYAYSIMWMHRDEGLDEQDLVRKYSERVLSCPFTRAYSKKHIVEVFGNYFDNIRIAVKYNVIDLPGKRKFKLDLPDEYELGWHTIVRAHRKAS
jgi:ubiquinone/menaquinone biosynthesis C-methylase UbiE